MKLRYTRRAVRQLDSIFTHIAADSPAAATGQIARTRHSIELLTRFPEMGHAGLSVGTFELVVPRTTLIVVYRVRPGAIDILSVFDGRRRTAKR